MRIAHLCLSCFFIDGFGYQENILPRAHKRMGHDVEIIASTETYINSTELSYTKASTYQNEDGITVHRLAYAGWVPRRLQPKIRAYTGLKQHLEVFKPDLIFLHDIQFWDILIVRDYALRHNVRVRADGHTDFINSARGVLSRYVLHGLFYRLLVKHADIAIEQYFPTLPARASFMRDVYGLADNKLTLLPFGIDDMLTDGMNRADIRRSKRERLGIPSDNLVLITGGKLDLRKNIHVLVKVFSQLRRDGRLPDTHLIIFGAPGLEVEKELRLNVIDINVHMIGWVEAKQIYSWFWSADIAIFPGTHSVLWEEAVGHGLPTIFHCWDGIEHLDLGGNAVFISGASPIELERILLKVRDNQEMLNSMREVAIKKGAEKFSYSEIARRSIESLSWPEGRAKGELDP